MADLEKIKSELDNLTLLEAAELVKMLEDAWGVSAAAPVAMAAAMPADGAAAPVEEEQTEFDVMLMEYRSQEDQRDQGRAFHHGSGPERGQVGGGECARRDPGRG